MNISALWTDLEEPESRVQGMQSKPHPRAVYDKLITAGKKPRQAIIAVMRKLLHAIWGVWNHNQDFDGQNFSE